MKTKRKKFTVLGRKVTRFTHLETFSAPSSVTLVTCESDEVTSVCPITNQPDWYRVRITYVPRALCVESKALKLYLQSFRNEGHFCESFAQIIHDRLKAELRPKAICVTVQQKPRGGVAIETMAGDLSS